MTVEFNEENNFNKAYQAEVNESATGFAGWLINKGIAKNKNIAQTIMVSIIVCCFLLSFYFFLHA